MLFAGEDGLENIDPNERNRQSRRERNAAMTEEDKEKRRAKDRERHAGSPCVTGPTSVGTKKNLLPVNMLICRSKRRRKGVQRQESIIIARNIW